MSCLKECSLLAQRIAQLAAGRAQVRLRGSTSREALQREGRALVEWRQRLRGCWGRATRGSQWGLGPRGELIAGSQSQAQKHGTRGGTHALIAALLPSLTSPDAARVTKGRRIVQPAAYSSDGPPRLVWSMKSVWTTRSAPAKESALLKEAPCSAGKQEARLHQAAR